MTDAKAPIPKHDRQAREHLATVHARRQAVQAQTAAWPPATPQEGAGEPRDPETEGEQ